MHWAHVAITVILLGCVIAPLVYLMTTEVTEEDLNDEM